MQRVIFLANKYAKEFFKKLNEHWGCEAQEVLSRFAVLRSTKDKIYLMSKDVEKVVLTDKRLDSIGLYFADVHDEKIRLSMEGSQLVGPIATRNVIDITLQELKQWVRGEDLLKEANEEAWEDCVILKYGNDFVGSGKYSNGTIYNFVPKTRRTKELLVST